MPRVTLTMTREEYDFLGRLAESQFREKRQQAQMIFTNALQSIMLAAQPSMQATGLRPSGADGQSLSSDSPSEGGGSNPPRA